VTVPFYHIVDINEVIQKGAKDYFIPQALYHQEMSKYGVTESDVIFKFAVSYKEAGQEYKEKLKNWLFNERPKINNVKELMLHIKTLLDPKQWENIQKEARTKKTMQEIIDCFPEVYRPILRLRFKYDKKIEEDKRADIESLEHTIAGRV
jgi:hypothetical protein